MCVDDTIDHMLLECPRYERERLRMVEIMTQETGTEAWDRMLEGNVKRVMDFFPRSKYFPGRDQ